MSRNKRRATPLTDDEKALIEVLHAEGKGRNEIARTLDRPFGTVTSYCQQAGLCFDRRESLRAATEIRQADIADLRSHLAHKLMVTAVQVEEELHQPATVYSFGGRDNIYTEMDVDQPPADAKRNLMATVGIAIDKSLKLSPSREENDVDAARSMLGTLGEAIAGIIRSTDTGEGGA